VYDVTRRCRWYCRCYQCCWCWSYSFVHPKLSLVTSASPVLHQTAANHSYPTGPERPAPEKAALQYNMALEVGLLYKSIDFIFFNVRQYFYRQHEIMSNLHHVLSVICVELF